MAIDVVADVRPLAEPVRRLTQQVLADYQEMPGLSVTLPQAQRLWAADQDACEQVFGWLISRGVLRATASGRFVRA